MELTSHLLFTKLYVEADAARLSQVFGNLLHNSWKFTKTGGTCRVTLSVDELKQLAVIYVADDGKGMSQRIIRGLFKPFVQADTSLDRSNGGLGLGLALVKSLVELHGGSVEASSNGLGQGSLFTIYLPLSVELPSVKVDEIGSSSAKHKQRILVIEDNKDVSEILMLLLVEDGHEVIVANDGTAGIAMAKDYRPDVILCDIGLPGMDGYQVANTLRSDKELQNTLLISLTGYARPEDIKRSQEAGFHYQLAKPVDLEELRQSLAQVKIKPDTRTDE